jgi:hypothetical protein
MAETKPDDALDVECTDRCVVHGIYYWIAILGVVLISVSRATWILTFWWYSMTVAIPQEIYLWIIVAIVFAPALHLFAAYCEVKLNRRRQHRYSAKYE